MAGEDETYLIWIRVQRCCFCDAGAPSDPHHKTGGGMGTKSHDNTAIPLCRRCHQAFHDHVKMFRWWDKEQKRNWHEAMIRLHRALYAAVRLKNNGEAVTF